MKQKYFNLKIIQMCHQDRLAKIHCHRIKVLIFYDNII